MARNKRSGGRGRIPRIDTVMSGPFPFNMGPKMPLAESRRITAL